MRYALFIAAAVTALTAFAAVPSYAVDQAGQVSGAANVRSGPSSSYEIIGKVRSGQKLDIIGCTRTWEWCDVKTHDKRGWIASRFLLGRYEGNLAGITNYGPKIGVEEIGFEERVYWGSHYTHTNFYKKRYGMQEVNVGGRDRYGDGVEQVQPAERTATWGDLRVTPNNTFRINN